MRHAILLPLTFFALTTGALAAQPDCENYGPGVHFSFRMQVGADYTEEEQAIFDQMHLRQNGIIARDTRRTAKGCIEAWVPDGAGGFETRYYDPRNLEGGRFPPGALRLQLD
ncbi:hypothetical protein [Devosia sp.]|uniref:hypothetical protein n=1 Tax=Devosia sp. TaxID=1871048 RepID=UPI002EEC1258